MEKLESDASARRSSYFLGAAKLGMAWQKLASSKKRMGG
jgi:hypothetical protein